MGVPIFLVATYSLMNIIKRTRKDKWPMGSFYSSRILLSREFDDKDRHFFPAKPVPSGVIRRSEDANLDYKNRDCTVLKKGSPFGICQIWHSDGTRN
jgi:hypothetical protein